MSSDILIHNVDDLKSKIYTIRGVQVMLDSDLAEIYGYTTKAFNQQIKNNIECFDEDFMFRLTQEESNLILKENIQNIFLMPLLNIDNYISLKTLVLLKNISPSVDVTIFSDNNNNGLHKSEWD